MSCVCMLPSRRHLLEIKPAYTHDDENYSITCSLYILTSKYENMKIQSPVECSFLFDFIMSKKTFFFLFSFRPIVAGENINFLFHREIQ